MMNKGRIVSGVLGMSLLGLGATSGQSAVLLRATAELSPHSSLSRSSFSQVGVGGLDGAAPGGVPPAGTAGLTGLAVRGFGDPTMAPSLRVLPSAP